MFMMRYLHGVIIRAAASRHSCGVDTMGCLVQRLLYIASDAHVAEPWALYLLSLAVLERSLERVS